MPQSNKVKVALSILLISGTFLNTQVKALQIEPVVSYFDSSWSMITEDEEGTTPGSGGQAFDAEYLLYKTAGSTLYIGLQSGFDLISGYQYFNTSSQDHYWSGDLALSFDGHVNTGSADPTVMANSYEFGIDFGLFTKNYNNQTVDAVMDSVDGLSSGIDGSGVYAVGSGQWNTEMVDSYEDNSSPFAMNHQWDGLAPNPLLTSLTLNTAGQENDSFYRAVAFDLTHLGLADLGLSLNDLSMDVHWTMSCGNDNINGHRNISVPEPGSLLLFAAGLLGLVGSRQIKRGA